MADRRFDWGLTRNGEGGIRGVIVEEIEDLTVAIPHETIFTVIPNRRC